MNEDQLPPPDGFPQYSPPNKGVRHIHPKQAAPLLKLFSKMVRRGKYRSASQKPQPKKKMRIV